MDDMQQKLNAILGNPEMMQQLMSMAQSLGQSQESPLPPQSQNTQQTESSPAFANGVPGLDMASIQRIAGLAQRTGIDRNQQTLLKALNPYLNREHITKLEKAMRAAKLAAVAATFLGSNSLFNTGR